MEWEGGAWCLICGANVWLKRISVGEDEKVLKRDGDGGTMM